jgi:hypothetical protein
MVTDGDMRLDDICGDGWVLPWVIDRVGVFAGYVTILVAMVTLGLTDGDENW